MHVAFNAYFWDKPHTGSGQYLRQLVFNLNRYVSDVDITLIYPREAGAGKPDSVPPSVRVHEQPIRSGYLGKVLFEQRLYSRACSEVGADLAHVPYWGSPLASRVPIVVTVHDLTTLLCRQYRRSVAARLYVSLVSASARNADAVITDSLASQDDISRHLAIPAQRVTAIYLAASPAYTPDGNLLMDMAVKQKYDLPDQYLLYLGGYERHKNVATLLLAYTYVSQALGDDYPLLLAGREPEQGRRGLPDYRALLKKLEISDQVRWLGYIDEEDKPALYRGARAFTFPSNYEGFGLPPLEAMACGVPVVTTNSSSLPEVTGDAAFTIDPDDARQMGGSIIAATTQDELRSEMRQKGIAQASKFSWQKTATETLLVYDSLLHSS